MSQADPSRRCAWRVLEAIDANPNMLIDEGLRRFGKDLDSRDAALARELCHGTLRMGLFYDAVMERYLTRSDPPPPLRRALRLAAHQILGMDRIPPHAVGASTGSLLRWGGSERLVGVANAIVRRLLADVIPGELAQDRLPPSLLPRDRALRFGLPPAFVRHLSEGGADIGDSRLQACATCPPLATRTLPGCTIADSPAILRRDGDWTWWRDPQAAIAGPVSQGQAVVQDPSQFDALRLAAIQPGERVLDYCAAPGGKTMVMAQQGARVIAADRSLSRLRPLRQALQTRQGLSHRPTIVVADGRQLAMAPIFDLVLVDAPCSNSGVWGRRPEARYRYDAEHLQSLQRLQGSLLRAAAAAVKPGGRLLYATCSLCPLENEEQVARLAGWRVEEARTQWPDEWQAGGYACLLSRG